MKDRKKITYTFLSGKISSTLIIPIEIARRCGFDKPVPVMVEEKDGGIFVRKLQE